MTQPDAVARRLFRWLVVAAVVALALLILMMRWSLNRHQPQAISAVPKELTVTIDHETFELRDGLAEKDAAPGSAAKNIVRVVGEPAAGDANGDGRPDTALLLRNDSGGSGAFYYAVLATADGAAYRASNVLALGDRITPETITYTGGRFVYRFLDRKPGEPMAAEPTVERQVVVQFDPAADRISAVS